MLVAMDKQTTEISSKKAARTKVYETVYDKSIARTAEDQGKATSDVTYHK